jgi:hypothetical protein
MIKRVFYKDNKRNTEEGKKENILKQQFIERENLINTSVVIDSVKPQKITRKIVMRYGF